MLDIIASLLFLVLVTVATVALFDLIQGLLEFRKRNYELASEQIDIFLVESRKLIRDETTPLPVVEFIRDISSLKSGHQLARSFTKYIKKTRKRKSTEAASGGHSEFAAAVERLNERQTDAFANVCWAAIYSSALSDGFYCARHLKTWRSHALEKLNSKANQKQSHSVLDQLGLLLMKPWHVFLEMLHGVFFKGVLLEYLNNIERPSGNKREFQDVAIQFHHRLHNTQCI